MGKPKTITFSLKKEVLQEFKSDLAENKALAGTIWRVRMKLGGVERQKETKHTRITEILQGDMLSLTDLIQEETKKKELLFVIMGWKVKDESSPKEIHVEVQLEEIFVTGFPIDRQKDIIKPFMRILKLKKISQEIEWMNKKFETKFVFSCKML